jgi:hypothetical protein
MTLRARSSAGSAATAAEPKDAGAAKQSCSGIALKYCIMILEVSGPDHTLL